MTAVRRARTMPTPDDLDRCGRCGKRIAANRTRWAFRDVLNGGRLLMACGKCSPRLKITSGFEEAT